MQRQPPPPAGVNPFSASNPTDVGLDPPPAPHLLRPQGRGEPAAAMGQERGFCWGLVGAAGREAEGGHELCMMLQVALPP